MEQQSLFSDLIPKQTTIRYEIVDLLTSVHNRMYQDKHIQKEISEIETFLMETARWSGTLPDNLIAMARERIKNLPNLSAIQAIRLAARGQEFKS